MKIKTHTFRTAKCFLPVSVTILAALALSIAVSAGERTLELKPNPGSIWKRIAAARLTQAEAPNAQVATHNIGNIHVGHTNLGQFGNGAVGLVEDPVTGEPIPSCIFPANSNLNHLYVAAFWIGAIIGRDTLVSSGADDGFEVQEFWPGANDEIVHRSIITTDPFYSPEALSEQDLIATYYDTLDNSAYTAQDDIDNRPHRPLGIKVVERSLQWSYEYASDFILFDYSITNIGFHKLEKVYMGIYVDADIHHLNKVGLEAYGDDVCGFRQTFPAECGFVDTVNIAYVMDNDGDPEGDAWNRSESIRSAAGVRLIRTPSDSLEYSFNWWSAAPGPDFGPRRSGTVDKPFRDMHGFLGAPHGDRDKYYMLSNGEFDYDQLYTAVDQTSDGWLPPPEGAVAFAQGGDPKFLLSFGPFSVFPGETLPITFAYLAGERIHTGATDFANLMRANPFQPDNFVKSLNFDDLGLNSRWASWIYDNPGVDTDNDGERGDSRICVLEDTTIIETTLFIDTSVSPPDTTETIDTVVIATLADTTFYTGDGIPDFRGASPPPAPMIRVLPNKGKLTVRWNGFDSETTADPFSGILDFEGYRIYTARTNERTQYVLQTSYDRENYNRFVYDHLNDVYELNDPPFTLEELRAIYGSTFDPLNFPIDNPFNYHHDASGTDSLYYFSPQDWNSDELGTVGSISKRFDVPRPSLNPDDWTPEDLTEDGYLKYYEYEFELLNLLPAVPVYTAVTAFDFGSPESGLKSLESSPLLNAVREYPLISSEDAVAQGLDVLVYPNPYRADGNYRASGYESIGETDLPDERARAMNFINLPLVCTISIFSLDGDLVRTIEHNKSPGSSGAMHEAWDMITRNIQPAVSGIYFYVVETPDSQTQIGKLVLIM